KGRSSSDRGRQNRTRFVFGRSPMLSDIDPSLSRITLVVPSRNRAHTLKKVAPSYYAQHGVSEIVFVLDGGTDDSPAIISEIAARHPLIDTKIILNETRLGAAQSRNVGVAAASNAFVLFSDDDEYLEPGYASICLRKLLGARAAAVSGRRVYMLDEETPEDALRRFGDGLRTTAPFLPLLCEYV